MPGRPDIDLRQVYAAADEGNLVAQRARIAREDMRWSSTPGDERREAAIAAELDQIDDAMRPIRSLIGRLTWDPIPEEPERVLRRASAKLQYERKQLKKMRRRR